MFKDLLIRIIIIVTVTNVVEFYVISKRGIKITPLLVIEIILVTLLPIVINIWYVFHKNGMI